MNHRLLHSFFVRGFGLGLGLVCVTTAALGCGSLGQSGEYSPQVLNGGGGPFRLATKEETGIASTPPGRMMLMPMSIGRSQIAGDTLVYDAALPLAAPPARVAGLAGWEVDWNQYEPRQIFRSTSHTVDAEGVTRHGYQAGTALLSPTEAWEIAGVYEPTLLVLPSGAVRLYYATEQGIGVAEAPSIDGTFVRLVASPILPDVDGRGAASSPAAVLLPTGDTMLYVEAGGAIFAARSVDGLTFTLVDGDATTGAIDPISLVVPAGTVDAGMTDAGGADADASVATEIAVRGPNALATESATGRYLVRLYFESNRTDGSNVLAAAGSFDGITFVRSAVVPVTKNNPSHPAAYLRPDGITVITFAIAEPGGMLSTAIPLLGLTPSERELPPP